MKTFVLLAMLSVLCASLGAEPPAARLALTEPSAPLPQRLSDTGLYVADSIRVRTDNIAFAPQYPLWSDGTSKRRWIYLPPGAAIDASRVDEWEFPIGTRLWKEFSYDRRVETRYIERVADGSWRFAAYVWNKEGTNAVLAPEDGAALPVSAAPGGRYVVPSRNDCLACHEGPSVPVLGFSALQASPDRDPLAPHAEPARNDHANLANLVTSGRLRNLPPRFIKQPPRIVATSPTARAALGYLHGNCGHCHNDAGALTGLELVLAQEAENAERSSQRTMQLLLGHSSRFRPQGADNAQRVARDGGTHMLTLRMKTNNPLARMPPLGVQQVDAEGVALIERWIAQHLSNH
ncbi:MAG TPA: hypothetical protein VNA44_01165 [Burkholderiaceae bacterium]|nr:hypothetical protein [Burkholderiaceae bacterium]